MNHTVLVKVWEQFVICCFVFCFCSCARGVPSAYTVQCVRDVLSETFAFQGNFVVV